MSVVANTPERRQATERLIEGAQEVLNDSRVQAGLNGRGQAMAALAAKLFMPNIASDGSIKIPAEYVKSDSYPILALHQG